MYNYCPYCGAKIVNPHSKQINYCRNCGQKLKNENVNKIDKVQCVVCHKYIWDRRFDTIECSFCGSKYHYRCASHWLIKYNSCPLCQNVFIIPSETISKIGH
jgi:ribosomal protein L37AE/L43A